MPYWGLVIGWGLCYWSPTQLTREHRRREEQMTTIAQKKTNEADAILKGERLLPAEALEERWHINRRQLLKRVREGHPCGQRLAAVWINSKKPVFRLADVVAFEEACARYDRSRRCQ